MSRKRQRSPHEATELCDDAAEAHEEGLEWRRRRTEKASSVSNSTLPKEQHDVLLPAESPSLLSPLDALRKAWPHRTGSYDALRPIVCSAMICANHGSPLKPYRPFTQMVGYMLLRFVDPVSDFMLLGSMFSATIYPSEHSVIALLRLLRWWCYTVFCKRNQTYSPSSSSGLPVGEEESDDEDGDRDRSSSLSRRKTLLPCKAKDLFPHLAIELRRLEAFLERQPASRHCFSQCVVDSTNRDSVWGPPWDDVDMGVSSGGDELEDDDEALFPEEEEERHSNDDEGQQNRFSSQQVTAEDVDQLPDWPITLSKLIKCLEEGKQGATKTTPMRDPSILHYLSIHSFTHILDAFDKDFSNFVPLLDPPCTSELLRMLPRTARAILAGINPRKSRKKFFRHSMALMSHLRSDQRASAAVFAVMRPKLLSQLAQSRVSMGEEQEEISSKRSRQAAGEGLVRFGHSVRKWTDDSIMAFGTLNARRILPCSLAIATEAIRYVPDSASAWSLGETVSHYAAGGLRFNVKFPSYLLDTNLSVPNATNTAAFKAAEAAYARQLARCFPSPEDLFHIDKLLCQRIDNMGEKAALDSRYSFAHDFAAKRIELSCSSLADISEADWVIVSISMAAILCRSRVTGDRRKNLDWNCRIPLRVQLFGKWWGFVEFVLAGLRQYPDCFKLWSALLGPATTGDVGEAADDVESCIDKYTATRSEVDRSMLEAELFCLCASMMADDWSTVDIHGVDYTPTQLLESQEWLTGEVHHHQEAGKDDDEEEASNTDDKVFVQEATRFFLLGFSLWKDTNSLHEDCRDEEGELPQRLFDCVAKIDGRGPAMTAEDCFRRAAQLGDARACLMLQALFPRQDDVAKDNDDDAELWDPRRCFVPVWLDNNDTDVGSQYEQLALLVAQRRLLNL